MCLKTVVDSSHSSSSDTCLAVLLPFQVTVFTINMAAGAVEHGTHYALNAVYSHRLKRSAFNMFSGYFGGSKKASVHKSTLRDC